MPCQQPKGVGCTAEIVDDDVGQPTTLNISNSCFFTAHIHGFHQLTDIKTAGTRACYHDGFDRFHHS
jgi:hypothetical protein